MNLFFEDLRHATFNNTYKILKDFETTDEASNIQMLYFYKIQANEEYEALSKEVIGEYKTGVTDPSREVGRIEKSRG